MERMNLHCVGIEKRRDWFSWGFQYICNIIIRSYLSTIRYSSTSTSARVIVDGGPNDASLSFSLYYLRLVRKPCLDQPQPIVLDYTRAEDAGAEPDAGFWGCSINSMASAAVSIPRFFRLEKLPILTPPPCFAHMDS